MDDTQFRAILAEMKESNKLMKAAVSELSQIKFELVNERIRRDAPKKDFVAVAQTGPSEYMPSIPSAGGEIPPMCPACFGYSFEGRPQCKGCYYRAGCQVSMERK